MGRVSAQPSSSGGEPIASAVADLPGGRPHLRRSLIGAGGRRERDLELYGLDLRLLHNLPGGIFELLLPLWLIVRGFKSSALAAELGGSTQGEPGFGRRVKV